MSSQPLDSKVAIVTGAAKGMGRAIAERLAADGAMVVVNYAGSAQEAASVVASIAERGGRAVAVQADVSSASASPPTSPTSLRSCAGRRVAG